jgi:hypothetical protein
MRKRLFLFCLIGVALALMAPPRLLDAAEADSAKSQTQQEPVLVGRVSHVEGLLTRYVPENKDWVATVQDSPFALDDALFTDEKGKAEIILPNNAWVRIGGQTQLQLLAIEDDFTELDLAFGVARFFNKSAKAELKVSTPYGYVLASHDTVFDLNVGDKSVEVIALQGTVDFVHVSNEARFEVIAKSSCLLADAHHVTSTEGRVNKAWDKWNCNRDSLWAKRFERCQESVKHLPEKLHSEAYALEEYGRWERVDYEGSSRALWRPTRVVAGWAPFTVGRWTVWHDEHCWMPAEPFGYVTHHYGNWVWVGSQWYWAPPVVGVSVHVGGPIVNIGLGWYPGRVAWLHSPVQHHVGWIPLAPDEIFYSHRYWGPASVVIGSVGASVFVTDIARYRYHSRAVVVRERSLYRVNNYLGARIHRGNVSALTAGYRVEPVVRAGLVSDPGHSRLRYQYRAGSSTARIDQRVTARVQSRSSATRQAQRVRGIEARERVSGFNRGRFAEGAAIERPRMASREFHGNSGRRGGFVGDGMASQRGGGGRGNDFAVAGGPKGNRGHGQGRVQHQGKGGHGGGGKGRQ